MTTHIMNRMKLIITALLCAVSSCLFGQTDNKQLGKLEKPWMDYNKALIQKLTSDIGRLQHELDSLSWMRQQRDSLLKFGSAACSATQQKKKASPKSKEPYASVAELARRKDWAENDSLKDVYDVLVKMYESVNENGGYVAKNNELFKKGIPALRKKLEARKSPLCESFNDLANQIAVFKDAIDELEKVKKLVGKMDYEDQQQYIEALDNDFEIEFVKAVPYTLHQLNECIKARMEQVKSDEEAKRNMNGGDKRTS